MRQFLVPTGWLRMELRLGSKQLFFIDKERLWCGPDRDTAKFVSVFPSPPITLASFPSSYYRYTVLCANGLEYVYIEDGWAGSVVPFSRPLDLTRYRLN